MQLKNYTPQRKSVSVENKERRQKEMGQMGRKKVNIYLYLYIDKNYLPRSSLISENGKKGGKKGEERYQYIKKYTEVVL